VAIRALLLWMLVGIAFRFAVFFAHALRRNARQAGRVRPNALELAIGFATEFLDTLGIGSFATTTTLLRARKLVVDRLLPGTLNVGHALPTALQALIYIGVIDVDPKTLALMIAAAVLGAHLGAPVVARWSEHRVRLGMGIALLTAAALTLARLLGMLPIGNDRLALSGLSLLVGLVGNFALGALMTLGIGLYAPCLMLIALLGMSPKAGFPIMMGSCAFLMPVASLHFVRTDAYAPRAALGLTVGGVPAVLIAAYLVKELPLDAVRWLVVIVVVYTALSLLWAARSGARGPEGPRG
jgi:uncharacterized membrane protein YfcA